MTGADAGALVAGAARLRGAGPLGEGSMRELLAPLGLPFVPATVVTSAAEAVAAADGPVVLKALSDRALHKSDLGLVEVGVRGPAPVTAAFGRLTERAAALGLDDVRVVVQPMVPEGTDFLVGFDRDPAFGPVVVVGLGGTTVELFRDVAHGLPPLSGTDAAGLLASLRSAPLLRGYRGAPPVDTAALRALVSQVGQLALDVPELAELDLNPVRVLPDGRCVVLDAAGVLAAPVDPDPGQCGWPDLRPLVEPASVAVVGASRTPTRPGARVLAALRAQGFPGRLYPVNPAGGVVDGSWVHRDLASLPEVPDLACVALPAGPSVETVRECVRLGVPAVIVFASGFSEAGPDGADLEAQLRAAVAGTGTVLCGPNTIGVVNAHLPMAATFSQAVTGVELRPAGTALIAQSGAVAGSLVSRELAEGYGIGDWVTVGNQSGLDVADYIAHFAERKATTALAVFLEGVPDGDRFRAALAAARDAGKPVVVFKTGTTDAGRRAVASHSGALAGSEPVYRAVLAEEGAIRVDRLSSLLPVAWTLGTTARAGGRRVAVVTTSGGAGSATVDRVAHAGLDLATLDAATGAALTRLLPSFARAANPLDVTAEGAFRHGTLAAAVDLVGGDPGVDLVCVVLTSITGPEAVRVASEIADAADRSTVPVLVTWLVARAAAEEGMGVLVRRGIRVFADPADMVEAAAHLVPHPAGRRTGHE